MTRPGELMTQPGAQQVRDRVLQLAREIEQLSQSDLAPRQFFEGFLKRVLEAVAAPAAAVWMLEQGRLSAVAEIGIAATGLTHSAEARQINDRALTNTLSTGESAVLVPTEAGDLQAPTDHLVILSALQVKRQPVGVVQLFQRPETPEEARPGYLQFLEQMSGYASQYLQRHLGEAESFDEARFWREFEEFTLQLQRSLILDEAAGAAANDGRLLLNCDRLSIGIRRGRKTTIRAISGQESVNQRANLVRTMSVLADRVIRMRETLVYTGRIEGLPPQIEVPLANYIQESGSRMLIIVPLQETPPLVNRREDQEAGETADRRTFGCLIAEQVSESEPRPRLVEHAELLAEHIAAALFNARQHQRIPMLRVWRGLGRTLEWFHGRALAKTLLILVVLVGAGTALAVVPWDYRVNGEGQLMPVVRREVFAPWDGSVVSLSVFGGEYVEAGDPLLVLENKPLQSELVEARNKRDELQELIAATKAQIDEDRAATERDQLTELLGQLEKTKVELSGVLQQITILEERLQALTVTAPISGVVATFQIQQRLMKRPVRRGEVLLEIMDDQQQWHLKLDLEEHRMGHILRAFERSDEAELRVEYRLATDPETTYEGTLARERLSTRTMKSTELGNVVEAFVEIRDDQPPGKRIGAEVQAKLYCGQRSLGYVLFGDVVEFVQKYLWL